MAECNSVGDKETKCQLVGPIDRRLELPNTVFFNSDNNLSLILGGALVAHLSIRDARNTLGTRETPE